MNDEFLIVEDEMKEHIFVEENKEEEKVILEEGFETGNYSNLVNKPKINGIIVEGDKKARDYKLQDEMKVISNLEIEEILKM